jgi:hypothetical protein
MTSKTFIKAVSQDWDIETLQLMITMINNRIDEIQRIHDIINPRTVIKGFHQIT